MNEPQQLAIREAPALGTISTLRAQGLPGKWLGRVILSACPSCRREKWVPLKWDAHLCNPCHVRLRWQPASTRVVKPNLGVKQRGALNHAWKGGRKQHVGGYLYVTPATDDAIGVAMVGPNGYVLEHRLVMARYLGRPLLRTETVHHRNGHRQDNRIENLELWIGNHGAGQRAHERHCPGCRCVALVSGGAALRSEEE